mmetsp:Transcript_68565/g.187983  ORF Transcript_68565/g.187983 Transcript_68565/m.187983 type:complete len:82 (+) Transcript_68565:586-831(+)
MLQRQRLVYGALDHRMVRSIWQRCGCVCEQAAGQHSIALSSTEAEIMAASLAAAEIIFLRGLLREMGVDMSEPTVLYVDNQ